MISKVKVIGLQRSGTNYLEELIRINFEVFVYDHALYPFFKHAGPYDEYVILNTGEKLYTLQPIHCVPFYNVLYVIIEKKQDFWIRSIKRYPADLRIKHPELFPLGNLNESLARQFHKRFYDEWKDVNSSNIVFVQYEDLIRDFTVFLQKLRKEYLLDKRLDHMTYLNVDKVKQSRRFTEDQRKQYLT